jgi:hypothetical protein
MMRPEAEREALTASEWQRIYARQQGESAE